MKPDLLLANKEVTITTFYKGTPNKLKFLHINKYDKNGLCVENYSSILKLERLYEYDEKNRLIKIIHHNPNKKCNIINYIYNKENGAIETIIAPDYNMRYEYIKLSNKNMAIIYKNDKLHMINILNENDKITESVIDDKCTIKYKYNLNGNIIEKSVITLLTGQIMKSEYIYINNRLYSQINTEDYDKTLVKYYSYNVDSTLDYTESINKDGDILVEKYSYKNI